MCIVNKYHKGSVFLQRGPGSVASDASGGAPSWLRRVLDLPILPKRQSSLNVEQLSNDQDQQGTVRMPNTMHVEKLLGAQF